MPKTVADWCLEQQVTLDQLAHGSSLDVQRVTAIALGRWTPNSEKGIDIDQRV